MAENNKAIKLYTGDVVAATSSKGNQEKWYDAAKLKNIWEAIITASRRWRT